MAHYRIGKDRRMLLRPNPNATLVVPKKGIHPSVLGARLSRSSRISLDGAAPSDQLLVRGEAAKLDEISDFPDVQHKRGAYTDAFGSELVLTDEVLVQFAKGTTAKKRKLICEQYGCTELRRGKSFSVLRVEDANPAAPLNVADALNDELAVEFAQPNALQTSSLSPPPVPEMPMAAAAGPPAPASVLPWHIQNTGQFGGITGADLKIPKAWEVTIGSPKIRVVVHDTGVEVTHPSLVQQCLPGWDFTENDPDVLPSSSYPNYAHGTAIAGLIAAVEHAGVVGVAPRCKIVPLRAQGYLTWERWAESFEWAGQNGDVIACPWVLSENTIVSEAIKTAVTSGRKGKGTPCFCAAGNDGLMQLAYPASLPETIAVGASTNQDRHASYSHQDIELDFVAPSSGGTLSIDTTDMTGPAGYNDEDDGDFIRAVSIGQFGGTSAATALAAGVAALMLSVNPDLTAEQVRQILRATSEQIDSQHGDYHNGVSRLYGRGRIDAAAAVASAKASVSTNVIA